MNEEVQKWSRKDPMAIKKGMACPGKSYKNNFLPRKKLKIVLNKNICILNRLNE